MNRLFSKDPMLRYAISLQYAIKPGRKHWIATHPNGYRTTIPFGRKRHPSSERNIKAHLDACSKPKAVP